MLRRLFNFGPAVITGVAGIITFLTFLNLNPSWVGFRTLLVQVAVIVAAIALLMGFIHLLYVHAQRIRTGKGAFYSLCLILAAGLTFAVMSVERILSGANTGPANYPASDFIFNGLIAPMQSALGALLAIFLAMAAFRMLRRRRTFGSLWFLLSALVVLITQVPLLLPDGSLLPAFTTARRFIDALTTGGMRGLLLGVAIGTIATALRVLLSIDRPQSE